MKTLLALHSLAILAALLLPLSPVRAQPPGDGGAEGSDAADPHGLAALAAIRSGGAAGIGFDSNPGNAEVGQTVPATAYANLQLDASALRQTGRDSALLLRASADAQPYLRYAGLSNLRVGLQARELYRPAHGFYAPTYSLWASAAAIGARSALRSGGEYRGGVAEAGQLSTAIALRLGAYVSEHDAGSDAMRLRHRAATADIDWRWQPRLSSHAGYEYRVGSFVTSSPADPGALALATAHQADDTLAIDGVANVLYRLNGYAHIATAGLNYALAPTLALDAQVQKIHTQASGGDHYDRWLVELSLLQRF